MPTFYKLKYKVGNNCKKLAACVRMFAKKKFKVLGSAFDLFKNELYQRLRLRFGFLYFRFFAAMYKLTLLSQYSVFFVKFYRLTFQANPFIRNKLLNIIRINFSNIHLIHSKLL